MQNSRELEALNKYKWNEFFFNSEFFVFGLTLPLSTSLNHISIFVICAKWLFLIYKYRELSFNWVKSYVVLLPMFFLIIGVSVFYSSNYSQGLFELEKLIYFILIPISFSIIVRTDRRNVVEKLATGFVLGNIILGFQFIVRYSFYDLQDNTVDDVIQDISPLHPTYLSLYLTVGILLTCNVIFQRGLIRYLACLFIGFFSVCIILSASKLGVLFLIIAILYIAYIILKRSSKLVGIGFIVISIISLTVMAIKSEVLIDRFVRIMSLEFKRHPVEGFNTFSGRLFFWDCAIKIYSKNFVFGVGVGDSQQELDTCYLANEKTVDDDFLNTYNVHNQFLQTLLDCGIAGFLVLFCLSFSLIRQSFKNREPISFLITVLVILFFIFETVLARDKGIVFFSSFTCILFYWFQPIPINIVK